ncbi:PE family protein [Mycobacterium paragordonae]|uniref:PE family protein n=1 Tax=Mycobacterium paragordonae TaxID=1389713 RepID=UPI00105BF112|nr:PE family protein [Mycobacterium paragordonae]TDK85639.1 PE family protein [Mycobacterium paragordonae]TDK99447.1 PE family protein [Mycobacterium paragordonae]
MSPLFVAPEAVSAASSDLEDLGASVRAAIHAAADRTGQIAPAAADEISQAIANVFGAHAEEFQAVSSTAAAFHDKFVDTLRTGAAHYLSAELANAQQTSTDLLNTSSRAPLDGVGYGTGAGAEGTTVSLFPSQSLGSFGPFEAYIRTNQYGGDIGIRLNTPFGPATLLSEGTSLGIAPDGSPLGTYHLGNPLLYIGFTADAHGPNGFLVDGLTFTFPGPALFGGYLPTVSYQPIYF